MASRWILLGLLGGLMGGSLAGCGQTGPLYHRDELGVTTEEVDLTDTIAERADPNELSEGVVSETIDGETVEATEGDGLTQIEHVPADRLPADAPPEEADDPTPGADN